MADTRTALTIITLVMFPAPTAQDAATGGKDHEIAKKNYIWTTMKSKRIAQPKLQFYKTPASC